MTKINDKVNAVSAPMKTKSSHAKMLDNRFVRFIMAVIEIEEKGRFSTSRYAEFIKSRQHFTVAKLMFYIFLSIIMPIINASLMLVFPLNPPYEGDWTNQFLVYLQLGIGAVTSGTLLSFEYSCMIPEAGLSFKHWISTGIPFGIIIGILTMLSAAIIGFPVPFTVTFPVMLAFPQLLYQLYYMSQKNNANIPDFRKRFENVVYIFMITVSLLLVYPSLSVVAAKVDSSWVKYAAASAFPVTKMLFRYWMFQHTIVQSKKRGSICNFKSDNAPVLINFTCEFYNSTYMAMLLENGQNNDVMLMILFFDIVLNVMFICRFHRAAKSIGFVAYTEEEIEKLEPSKAGKVFSLLHAAEFIMLTEFVESAVPLLYSKLPYYMISLFKMICSCVHIEWLFWSVSRIY